MEYQRCGDRGARVRATHTPRAPVLVVVYTFLATAGFTLGPVALVEFALPARHNDQQSVTLNTAIAVLAVLLAGALATLAMLRARR